MQHMKTTIIILAQAIQIQLFFLFEPKEKKQMRFSMKRWMYEPVWCLRLKSHQSMNRVKRSIKYAFFEHMFLFISPYANNSVLKRFHSVIQNMVKNPL